MTAAGPPPAAPPVTRGGFCGRCGTPFPPGSAGFCGHCGAPIAALPPAAQGYTYAVLPPAAVPATHHKLGNRSLWMVAGSAIAALVIVITAVVVLARPQPGPVCGASCPPPGGPPLAAPHTFTSTASGWSVDYTDDFKLTGSDASSISLDAGGCPFEVFTAASGDPRQVIDSTLSAKYPSAKFGTPAPKFDVRGAHIGDQPATGEIYDATVSPQQGGSQDVRIAVIAATRDGVTVVADGYCVDDPKVSLYELANGEIFDYVLTEFRWKGE